MGWGRSVCCSLGQWGQALHGDITWEGEGAKDPTEWRRNDKKNERFSKDILIENRKLESDPREDWLLLAREGQDLKGSSLRKDSWKYNSQELLTLSYLCYNKLCLWPEGLIRNPVALQVCWDLIFAASEKESVPECCISLLVSQRLFVEELSWCMSETNHTRMFLVLQEKIHILFWLNIKPGTISLLAKEGSRKEHELFKNKIVIWQQITSFANIQK